MQPSGGIFDFDAKTEQLAEVIRELEQPNVWDDPARAQQLGKKRTQLGSIVDSLTELETSLSDAKELFELACEEKDEAALKGGEISSTLI